jgi:hypothetical protein
VLAWKLKQDHLAQLWLTAIRYAERPTIAFQITCIYRQLRDQMGLLDQQALGDASTAENYQQARTWMVTAGAT